MPDAPHRGRSCALTPAIQHRLSTIFRYCCFSRKAGNTDRKLPDAEHNPAGFLPQYAQARGAGH